MPDLPDLLRTLPALPSRKIFEHGFQKFIPSAHARSSGSKSGKSGKPDN
jgi:hypothetical protein